MAAPAAEAVGASQCRRVPAPAGQVIDVRPAQAAELPGIVAGAPAGSTIRFANGTYPVSDSLVVNNRGVTLRSASGDPTSVVLDAAYGPSALIHPFAGDVTVTDLTLRRARDHLVHAYPRDGGPDLRGLRLHRLVLVDAGEQFVKVNQDPARSAGVHDGTVSCSNFRMTAAGRQNIERAFGCYTGGIDVQQGSSWRVFDNRFEGIYCEDGEVAEHAIHFWNGARETLVENNTIVNCSRGIGFGLGDAGGGIGHHGGLIRNNVLLADIPQYDTGIELHQAQGARVFHNTIAETDRATNSFSSIDYRFANTQVEIRNNLVRRITERDGGRGTLSNNVEQLPLAWLTDPRAEDFHLTPAATGARDQGMAVAGAGLDIDGRPHDFGAPDIGADEVGPPVGPGNRRRPRVRLVLRGRRQAGARLRLVGTVTPWVAGQRVRVTLHRRDRVLRSFRARIGRLGSSRRGRFIARFRVRQRGPLLIRARHRATPRQRAFSAGLRVLVR